jgi:hypothetical protein
MFFNGIKGHCGLGDLDVTKQTTYFKRWIFLEKGVALVYIEQCLE